MVIRQNKRETRPAATRERILDAVDHLLARYGYKKMTMDELARTVGIAKGSIYLHFRSKRDVVLARVDRVVQRLVLDLSRVAETNASAVDRLRRMLTTRVLFRFDRARHYSESLDEVLAAIRSVLLERRRRHFAWEAQVFVRVLEDGTRRGEFTCDHPRKVARLLLLATDSLLPYSLSVQELGNRTGVERKASALAELLVDGLRFRSLPSFAPAASPVLRSTDDQPKA